MNFNAITLGALVGLMVLLISIFVQIFRMEQVNLMILDRVLEKTTLLTSEVIELNAEVKELRTELITEFKATQTELLKEISGLVDEVKRNNDQWDTTNTRLN